MKYRIVPLIYLLLAVACIQEKPPTTAAPVTKDEATQARRSIGLLRPPQWEQMRNHSLVLYTPVVCITINNESVYPAAGMILLGRGVQPKCPAGSVFPYLEFSDNEAGEAIGYFALPARNIEEFGSRQWNHKLDAEVKWTTHGTEGAVIWQIETKCPDQVGVSQQEFKAEVPKTAEMFRTTTFRNLGEGCKAGDHFEFTLRRLYNGAEDIVPWPLRMYALNFIIGVDPYLGS